MLGNTCTYMQNSRGASSPLALDHNSRYSEIYQLLFPSSAAVALKLFSELSLKINFEAAAAAVAAAAASASVATVVAAGVAAASADCDVAIVQPVQLG